MLLQDSAPAKINLSLHVGPPKPNGRHDLNSLIVFSDSQTADQLSARPAAHFSLAVEGQYARQAGPARDNLVLKAARAMQENLPNEVPALAFRLIKNLPCAAGIGGGSSDAAAALRLIIKAHGGETARQAAWTVAPRLGGDVLSCLHALPGLMQGEGEHYDPMPSLPPLAALLVNPGQACPTGPVFAQYDMSAPTALPDHPLPPAGRLCQSEFIAWLRTQTCNSLEAPACELIPQIGDILTYLDRLPDVRLSRMSGSGATCFALFDDMVTCQVAKDIVQQDQPDWWVCATQLGNGI